MTRTLPANVWPDGSAPAKGDIRAWANEVDARLVFQTRGALEAASIAGAGTAVRAVVLAGRTQAGDVQRPSVYAWRDAEPTSGEWAQSADGAYWLLVAPDPSPEQFGAVVDGTTNNAVQAQAVIDALEAVGGGVMTLTSNRRYRINAGLVVDGVDVTIRWHGAALIWGGSASAAPITTINGGRVSFDPPLSPELFGAARDGTDDQPEIRTAILQCHALGGGHVRMRPGVYGAAAPIVLEDGVALVGEAGGQFDAQSVTTIRATSAFAGVAVIHANDKRVVGLRNLRVEGTLRHEADFSADNLMVGGSSGVGEHGLLMQRTGTLVIEHVSARFCDGAGMLFDGAWQTWCKGGFQQYNNAGGIVFDTVLTDRKCSQWWGEDLNVQKNRIAGFWVRDRGDGTSAEHDGLLNHSQIHLRDSIIEFAFDAVDDSEPRNYDAGFLGLVVVECGEVEMRGTAIAPGATIDPASRSILLGTPTAASRNDSAFGMHGGIVFGFASDAIVGFRSIKVSRCQFHGTLFTLTGTKNLIALAAATLPWAAPVFDLCTHVRFGESRPALRPLDANDVLVSGASGDAALDIAARVSFVNPPGLRFGQLVADAGDSVSAGGTFVRNVSVPDLDRDTAVDVYHVDQADQWLDVSLGDLTVTVAPWAPGIARVTYSNATGASIAIPASTVMVRGWRDAGRFSETTRRSADLTLTSVAAGATVTGTLTAQGVEPGDMCEAAYSVALPTAMHLRGQVTATDTITWEIINHTGASVDRPAGYVLARVRKS